MIKRTYLCSVCLNKEQHRSFRKIKTNVCTDCQNDLRKWCLKDRTEVLKELNKNHKFKKWFGRQSSIIHHEYYCLFCIRRYTSSKTRMFILLINDIINTFQIYYKDMEKNHREAYNQTVSYFKDWILSAYKASVWIKNIERRK